VPGSYRFANDIVGTITIAASNVTLDLEGRILTGVGLGITVTGQSDIVIKNGQIRNAADRAIVVNQCTNVFIQNLDLTANATALYALTTTCLSVSDCTFRQNTAHTLTAIDVNNSIFEKSIMKYNTTDSVNGNMITLMGCSNIQFDTIHSTTNVINYSGDLGVSITNRSIMLIQDTLNLIINNCSFNDNFALMTTSGPAIQAPNALIIVRLAGRVSDLTISNCTFNRNISPAGIGIISSMTTTSPIAQVTNDANGVFTDFNFKNLSMSSNITGTFSSAGTLVGINVPALRGATIENVIIENNTAEGAAPTNLALTGIILSCTAVICNECVIQNNESPSGTQSVAFRLVLQVGAASSDIILNNCIANKNDGFGFRIGGNNVQCIGCSSIDNANNGFEIITNSVNCSIEKCIAIRNINGIVVTGPTPNCRIRENQLIGNEGTGLLTTGAFNVLVFGNLAQGNGINYSTSGPILTVNYTIATATLSAPAENGIDNISIT
jgi:hypothetical protein